MLFSNRSSQPEYQINPYSYEQQRSSLPNYEAQKEECDLLSSTLPKVPLEVPKLSTRDILKIYAQNRDEVHSFVRGHIEYDQLSAPAQLIFSASKELQEIFKLHYASQRLIERPDEEKAERSKFIQMIDRALNRFSISLAESSLNTLDAQLTRSVFNHSTRIALTAAGTVVATVGTLVGCVLCNVPQNTAIEIGVGVFLVGGVLTYRAAQAMFIAGAVRGDFASGFKKAVAREVKLINSPETA